MCPCVFLVYSLSLCVCFQVFEEGIRIPPRLKYGSEEYTAPEVLDGKLHGKGILTDPDPVFCRFLSSSPHCLSCTYAHPISYCIVMLLFRSVCVCVRSLCLSSEVDLYAFGATVYALLVGHPPGYMVQEEKERRQWPPNFKGFGTDHARSFITALLDPTPDSRYVNVACMACFLFVL